VEPTGIEPVTSCLQNELADALHSPIFLRVSVILATGTPLEYGRMRSD